MNEEDYKFNNRMNNYKAFQSRVKIFEMTKGHANTEEFPYTADDLAIYMLDLVLRNRQDDPEEEITQHSDNLSQQEFSLNSYAVFANDKYTINMNREQNDK